MGPDWNLLVAKGRARGYGKPWTDEEILFINSSKDREVVIEKLREGQTIDEIKGIEKTKDDTQTNDTKYDIDEIKLILKENNIKFHHMAKYDNLLKLAQENNII